MPLQSTEDEFCVIRNVCEIKLEKCYDLPLWSFYLYLESDSQREPPSTISYVNAMADQHWINIGHWKKSS